ncbi:hypothetical protein [Brevibacillus invocatus]|uniref:hypothetical protein n=1 Tax=Brevibacillus invocatus TaxID=173959 RepID=UPI0039F058FB
MDSGYTRAQKIWQHKFGEPAYLLQDYWGEGVPHMIWRVNVNDFVSEKSPMEARKAVAALSSTAFTCSSDYL